ncbi:MAG TPA: VCBS repeat-containing protein, partial [Candidatus Krumholzibacteria bacterium]|nr:VCBS repeat-containing protein [Candidatus Krumholzibacteria bacterium]
SRATLAAPRAPGILREAWRRAGDQPQSNWGQTAAVVDIDGDGFSELIAGESLWIGADSVARGRVVVFPGTADGPSAEGKTVLTGDVRGFAYGHYAADAGDVDGDGVHDFLITEVPYKMEEGPGHVFLFHGGPGPGPLTPWWTHQGQSRDSGFGLSMMSGDVNGDGYSDVVIGEPVATDRIDREGIVRMFLGSRSGLSSEPAWTVRGEQAVAQLGGWMRTTGDVNGDGFDDVLVTAPFWDGATTDCGQARLYLGGKDGVAEEPAWTAEGSGTNSHFGTTVSGAGDVNGDGFGDVIIGEPQYSDASRPERGRVLLFLGGREGLSKTPAWQALGPIAYMHVGYSVLGLGDIDGDGLADIAVGAPQYTEGKHTHLGVVEVYRGTREGCEATAAWRAIGTAADEHFGFTMAVGDMNGDHIPDLIVSAPLFTDTLRERGLLISYLGQRLPK